MKFFLISQEHIDKVSDSPYTYAAFAYTFYEISKPIRIAVTVGGTTIAVKYLSEKGIIQKTNSLKDKGQEKNSELKHKKDEIWYAKEWYIIISKEWKKNFKSIEK